MPLFDYTAVSDGRTRQGTLQADDPRLARDRLRAMGLLPREVRLRKPTSPRLPGSARRRREDTHIFLTEMSTLLRAGVPVSEALRLVARQVPLKLGHKVLAIAERVEAGEALAAALEAEGGLCDRVCCRVLAAGEAAGDLSGALGQLAEQHRHGAGQRQKLVTALTYPAILALVITAVALFLMLVVLPGVMDTLASLDQQPPWLTRQVMSISSLLGHWGWLALPGVIGVIMSWRLVRSRPAGRLALDRMVLRLPLIGKLIVLQAVARVCRVMATLLAAGVGFEEAMRYGREASGQAVFSEGLGKAEEDIRSGRDIGPALEGTGCFSPTVIRVLALGQQSGDLTGALSHLAEDHQARADHMISRLSGLIEPCLIVLLACVVGTLVYATVQPILEMSHGF